MNTFEIDQRTFMKECEQLAKEIFDYYTKEFPEDDPDLYRDEMFDQAHEVADGHNWVIYTYKAIMICAHCDVTEGEEFIEDVGPPQPVTFGGMATAIAYAQMLYEIERELDVLILQWEPPEEDDEDDDEDDEE